MATSKALFAFDPEKDGQIVAVERLVSGSGPWEHAWNRYREAPNSFAGVRRALDLVQPKDLLHSGNERIPANNKSQEDALRTALKALGQLSKGPALDALSKLAAEHLKRADSVWGTLGEAPLASAVAQLGILAERVRQYVSGEPSARGVALALFFGYVQDLLQEHSPEVAKKSSQLWRNAWLARNRLAHSRGHWDAHDWSTLLSAVREGLIAANPRHRGAFVREVAEKTCRRRLGAIHVLRRRDLRELA